MGAKTGIQWCDATWNPWQGCTKVSSGCKFCYMYREKKAYGQDPSTVIRSKPATFNLPKKLVPGKRVFVCSWSDFFHEGADPWRGEAWKIIRERIDLTFIIPTKRLDRVLEHTPWFNRAEAWRHVWLLYSASKDDELNPDLQTLLQLPYAIRGVSLEPLLGMVESLEAFLGQANDDWTLDPLDWVIVAGESGGPENRALVTRESWHGQGGMKYSPWEPKSEALRWVRQIRDWCFEYEVAFHFKGWGGPRPTSGGRLLDGREWNEFPKCSRQRAADSRQQTHEGEHER